MDVSFLWKSGFRGVLQLALFRDKKITRMREEKRMTSDKTLKAARELVATLDGKYQGSRSRVDDILAEEFSTFADKRVAETKQEIADELDREMPAHKPDWAVRLAEKLRGKP